MDTSRVQEMRKPDDTDKDVQRRLAALAAASGAPVEDLQAECDAITARINEPYTRVNVYEEAARHWVLLEVTALVASTVDAMLDADGVLAAYARNHGARHCNLISNAMPAAMAELDRVHVIIDALNMDAEQAARVGVAAAYAAYLDEAIEYITPATAAHPSGRVRGRRPLAP